MSLAHASHAQVVRCTAGERPYDARMTTSEATATRTLALELPEADWHALRALEPDAVAWLRTMIRHRLAAAEDLPETDQFDEYLIAPTAPRSAPPRRCVAGSHRVSACREAARA